MYHPPRLLALLNNTLGSFWKPNRKNEKLLPDSLVQVWYVSGCLWVG